MNGSEMVEGQLVSKDKEILRNEEAILVWTRNNLIVVDGVVQSCTTV